MAADYFQFEASVSGHSEATGRGETTNSTTTGTLKAKGSDEALSIVVKGGKESVAFEAIHLGEWSYERDEQGVWTKKARADFSTYPKLLQAGLKVEGKGVEARFGRQLHRVESTNITDELLVDAGWKKENGPPYPLRLIVWAQDDGTPVGVTESQSYDLTFSGVTTHFESSTDFVFEKFSGVTIEAPI